MLVVCAWLVLAANASAAPTWLPPTDIAGPTESITFPEVAVNPAGDAVAIWPRDIGSDTVIEALERPAGGEWSEPEVLSDPGEEEPSQVHIGLDAAGNAVAIWRSFDSGFAIRTAVRPAGGDWSAADDLFTEGGQSPDFAMNAAGDAVAVWNGYNGEDFVTWAAVRPAGGDWLEPEDLSVTGEADWFGPQVGISANGNAIAVWERLVTGDDDVVRAAVRPAGGDWSAPDDLSVEGEDVGSPTIAMNEAGDAVAAWTVSGGGIQGATRPAGGDWSAPDEVSAAGGEPELEIDSSGNAFALWPGDGATDQILRVAMRTPGGDWSAPDELSAEAETFQSYGLDASPKAGVIATWTRGVSPTSHEVQAAVRPPGSDWSAPDDLSLEGEDAGIPKLDFDAAGNAIVIWGRKEATAEYFLRGAGYDFSGPQLNGLQIPAAGAVGELVSFAVSPFDVFSLGTTSWTFGDGSPAGSGNAVSHVYTAPGAYPVTVSAVDGSGNVSTQGATIAISGPPPPPPPPPPGKIALSLRLGQASLSRLLRSGGLVVHTTVNEPARVVLSGKARLRAPGRGARRTKQVTVFKKTTVQFTTAGEQRVKLGLSKGGRTALRDLEQVKISVTGKATDATGETATKTLTRTLR